MKKRNQVLLLAAMIFSVAFISLQHKNKKPPVDVPVKTLSPGSFAQQWLRVDSLSKKGLSKSALEVVMSIYKKAKAESNSPQLVKAAIHRMKFQNFTEEDATKKIIADLKKEISESAFPARPLLHSMLAEIFQRYYEQNRYRFLDRTETVDYKNDDINTWGLKKIFHEIAREYHLSLADADSSQRTPVNMFDEVIEKGKTGDTRNFRPTLYDFLAHRALDFFMNDESGLTQPANKFEMNKAEYFYNTDLFLKATLNLEDTLSMKFNAVVLFRELMAFHKKDVSPAALIDADLDRLGFVYRNSTLPGKDSLYVDALNELEKKYSNDPGSADALYELALLNNEWGNRYSFGEKPEAKRLIRKAKQICDDAMERFPKSPGAINCKSLKCRIEEKSMSFVVEQVNIPDRPVLAKINYKNLSKIYFRVVKNDRDEINNYEGLYGEKLIRHYTSLPVIREWSVDMEADEDYQNHSVEIKIPGLPAGNYILLSASDPGFSYEKNGIAYSTIWISNISYVSRRKENGGYDFFVMNRESGAPMPAVTAKLYVQQYNYISRKYENNLVNRYKTSEDGSFTVEPVGDYRNFDIEFTTGTDRLFLNDNFYQYHDGGNDRKKYQQTFFFTDRSIYRPGQTIYFKGIIVEKDGENNSIKTKQSTAVLLYDVNGQKVSEQKFTTNEYGTFSGSFTAPTGLLNGVMRIQNENGSMYFSVEEYKRPKFEVKFEPISGVYRLNDKIMVKGKATSYSGVAVDQAQVQYRVVRTARFPYWNYYWRSYPSSAEMEILNGNAITDDKGEFTIVFDAIPDLTIGEENEPVFNFHVSASITDINGETQSETQNIEAGYKALMLSVIIPAELNNESGREFLINTRNMSGSFVAATGNISIVKLNEPAGLLRNKKWSAPEKQLFSKEEFKKSFPFDVYGDEDNPEKWESGNVVYNSPFDSGKDSLLHLAGRNEWKPGVYKITASSKDKYSRDVRFTKFFTVYSPSEKQAATNSFARFSVLKDNAEPGGTDRLLIGTHDKDVKVLYEVEQKNEIISKEWMTLNDEQRLIEIPILEKYRGNIAVHVTFILHNRDYHFDHVLTIPYTNKQLDISFETFRSKLYPGQQEEWKMKIRGSKGEKVAAEMLATMYDASLDAFRPHDWRFDIYNLYYASLSLTAYHSFAVVNSNLYGDKWNVYLPGAMKTYDQLNWFGYNFYGGYDYGGGYHSKGTRALMDESVVSTPRMAAQHAEAMTATGDVAGGKAEEKSVFKKNEDTDKGDFNSAKTGEQAGKDSGKSQSLSAVKGRSNFNETAFFYPHLTTNDSGEIIVSFTIPEALTRWKMMGFASTTDLKYGMIEKELLTQKELMVIPDAPRFFREGDKITFKTKISNQSDSSLTGTAELFLFDAITMKPLNIFIPSFSKEKKGEATSVLSFSVAKGQSTLVQWNLAIPEGVGAITYKVVAKSGNFSDGEERAVPVLSNRMLVTETLPLPVRGKQNKAFEFSKLKNSASSATLNNHKLTLEFTSNPAWYAVQALPYLMEFPYECSEQIFSRYYANAIASHIANSSPKIKAVFDSWKSKSPDAFLSNLEKNQELKSLMLEETPWVLDAKNETERKKRVGLLFDLNKMSNELNGALVKLQKKQTPNGAWSWFEGMPDDRYITQYMVEGFGHLDHLGVKNVRENDKTWSMVKHAVQYLDARIKDDFNRLVETKVDLQKNHLSSIQIQYLYARSYFKDLPVAPDSKKAFGYYKEQCQKYWLSNGEYLQGMIALALYRYDDKLIPSDILKSLKENSQHSEELGMYWKNNSGGYYWMQAPVETQALLIEAFDEIAKDQQSVNEMKVWLLKQKQTQDWKTTKATAEACYALLLKGTNWLAESSPVEITIGGKKMDPSEMPDVKVEAGTGYFKTSWSGTEISPAMADVTVNNRNDVVTWGAMYWQYFEQLDKITPHQTPLNLKKELFVEKPSSTGPVIFPVTSQTMLKPGDRVKVRIELRVDRNMEYVMMKDMRASGFEPEQVLSQYKWQDGLGYYETTRDASVNFFFSYLNKGTYVFEYPLRVAHSGDFSNGITEIQCMYAPEFAAHSEGIRVKVGE
ncbi:MAG: MG2 domain-containing protein [Bacteroidetes bacterium]|nr:MG2 domain-containing protein [Bacteroidota bacterium]